MINNLQNLFIKYKNKILEDEALRDDITKILEKYIPISRDNIVIDQRRKEIKIENLKSSFRFILKSKEDEVQNIIKEKYQYIINF